MCDLRNDADQLVWPGIPYKMYPRERDQSEYRQAAEDPAGQRPRTPDPGTAQERWPVIELDWDESRIRALCAEGVARVYPRNTIVVQEGDESAQVYVVLSGKLKVYLTDGDGKQLVLDTLVPTSMFGEMSLDGSPRSASVITQESSRLAIIQHDRFRAFLAGHPDAAFGIITLLTRRARHLTRIIGSLGLLDVYGRVVRQLTESAQAQAGKFVVQERLTHQEIAQRVGASRETVARIMSDLRQGGYISVEGDRIWINRALPDRW